jgi:CspA family cold shock protein
MQAGDQALCLAREHWPNDHFKSGGHGAKVRESRGVRNVPGAAVHKLHAMLHLRSHRRRLSCLPVGLRVLSRLLGSYAPVVSEARLKKILPAFLSARLDDRLDFLPLRQRYFLAPFGAGRRGNQRRNFSMTIGTVKFFNTSKGFGFIAPEGGGKDVFVHATAVEAAGMRSLNEGQKVSFDIVPDARGAKAANLKSA